MSELQFGAVVSWKGRGKEGRGSVSTGGQEIAYSGPESMGGAGTGTSPEELLASAVASCYTSTLYHMLLAKHVDVDSVRVGVGLTVGNWPEAGTITKVTVNPTILGGDPARKADYEATARQARDRCFIGKALRADIEYAVGEVGVTAVAAVGR